MTVQITTMKEQHLDQVLRIEQEISGIPWSRRLFEEEIARAKDRRYRVAVTEENEELLGYLGMLYIIDEAHIATVGVDPNHWGHQVATRLVLDALEAALAEGIKDCTLEVRAHNDRAKRLYQRFGFAPVALRRGYYHDNGEDAIIMWLYDLDAPSELARRRGIADTLKQDWQKTHG
ncbi:ribosomal protein S18-alanine N-acetyltransferase [Ferrimicrobium sp.]|uniref:ribosomal protein S18-alanine N-acetyltransferase n=1 Tax=Ferrimicrobium sp. TaxID=2926050 RepID=UPI002608DF7E|nr:ribosomal protein S18-alanine N-acetyltransferase [Ferrimicrobium sp.]